MGLFLDKINSPEDLKRIRQEDLPALAWEIRKEIIEVVSRNGGHLASSLGAVEIAIALHYLLEAPNDSIIWDVGHQAYAHKILTGRKENFPTLRQFGGISGFPSSTESIYDPFTTGHSSTAVSLALGLAQARDLKKENRKVVAIIGDGSLSGGLCFEALNQAGQLKTDLLVILNTNEMAISPVMGALSNYLNKIISLPIYNRIKDELEIFIKRIPRVGPKAAKAARKFEEGLKNLLVPGVFFEELGFRYFGPLDGHNIDTLLGTLRNVLNLKGPVLLHVVTKKGKGYIFSEKNPERFHSAPAFDINTGQPKDSGEEKKALTYTEVFSQKLVELARKDERIVAITAAMPHGTGLNEFAKNFPGRFFDVGIAEAHAVAFASGLAKGGLKPVAAIYSTFLQRAYDQIIEEVALQNLGIVLCLDRAGLVGEDGPTHHGLFDIAYLKNIPNMVVMAPKDGKELASMLELAMDYPGPMAIRYPKSPCPPVFSVHVPLEMGKAEVLRRGKDIAIIALGSMVYPSLKAVEKLEGEGISVELVNARFVKPLDGDLIKRLSFSFKRIVVVEEGVRNGGLGSFILEELTCLSHPIQGPPIVHIMGLPNEFIAHGKREILLKKYGLTAEKIANSVRSFLSS